MVSSRSEIPGTVTVTAHMSLEHDALDRMLRVAATLADAGELRAAVDRLDAVTRAVGRHLWLEETVLFPLYETRRVGADPDPARRAPADRGAPRRDAGRADRGRAARVPVAARGFLALIGPHEHREESVVFPAVDRIADPVELALLVQELRAFR